MSREYSAGKVAKRKGPVSFSINLDLVEAVMKEEGQLPSVPAGE